MSALSSARWWQRLVVLSLAAVLALLCVPHTLAEDGPMYSVQERFGVGVARQYGDIIDYDVASLHIGWYSDWSYNAQPQRPGGIEYVQLVRTQPDGAAPDWDVLSAAVRSNPGADWLIGNEPDARPGVQDSQPAASYAKAYHDVYTFIKDQDPTAQVGPGGVIQPTPLRLRYMDMVLAAYEEQYGAPFPADVWSTHVQILQESREEWGAGIPQGIADATGRLYSIQDNAGTLIFQQLVRELRAWMAARGMRNKPLIISEFGVLMPSLYLCYCYDHAAGDAIVASFMRRSFDFLLNARDPDLGYPADQNRLVQRWSWYSLNDKLYDVPPYGEGYNGSLYDFSQRQFPGRLTVFGRVFMDYMHRLLLPNQRYLPLTVLQ